MKAICECGHSWELQKDLDAYTDGPRCPDCQSRDITVEESDDATDDADPVANEAFRRFREGDEALDLVCDGLCTPARARELEEAFMEMSDHRLVSNVELAKLRHEARKEGVRRVLQHIDEEYAWGIDTSVLARELG